MQAQQGAGGELHRADHVALRRVEPGAGEQRAHADERVERRAQLVAHDGEEAPARGARNAASRRASSDPPRQRRAIERQHAQRHEEREIGQRHGAPQRRGGDDAGEPDDAGEEAATSSAGAEAQAVIEG